MGSFVLVGMTLWGVLMSGEKARATAPSVEGTVTSAAGAPVKDALVVVYPQVMGRGEPPGE